ncbi:AfsR/SARP family transcriptional regulator [Virgisporangium aurantiacum]|uniref:SARP family transcriptional regulator n=1 Tax=Virgisporangium aurantiacum TaxID=175570 RepID=A0A8J3YY43_9ACTN|nr:BTAD domain-containing putative transcriptional regulator [Virgisporangium aurantiacum]GIJ53819.1 SARP family transcriptional regulator [Virgisporangium aurantiacum]
MFGLLGPVQAFVDGVAVPVAGPRSQALLAALLLERDGVLPVDRLIDLVWGDEAPASARVQVQNRVAGLRRLLRDVDSDAGGLIQTQGSGYRLRLPADRGQLDVDVFEQQVREAERHAVSGSDETAVKLLGDALSLWRGPALDGLESPAIAAAAQRLNERRTTVRLRWAEMEIKLGRAVEVVGELAELSAQDPWHEKLAGQLMTALYLSDRRRDALRVFDQVRQRLADELGLDPGPELSCLRDRILRNDPVLATAIATAVAPAVVEPRGAPTVPRQLPGAFAVLAGRVEQLRRLDALLSPDGDPARAAVAVIEGPAGIGKTTLAVHWANRVVEHFGDGQFYVNLRGFSPDRAPMSAAEAVRGLLESLQVPAQRIPDGFDARIGMYRSLLADKRALIVLDNARDVAQVRPLLPGTSRCVTVVTSRDRLFGLVVTDAVHLLSLGVLSAAEAHELFTRRVGPDRVTAEPEAAQMIMTRCAGLPLALAVVAARVAAHPEFPLSVLADELCGSPGGLDSLRGADPASDVRTVFSWSYARVGAPAASLFRLLGLHPGPDIGVAAAASLAGTDERVARRLLAELADVNLVTEHLAGRYTLHDLLRAYAVEQAHAIDDAAHRRAAVHRMLDHYLRTAHAAAVLRDPHRMDPNSLATAAPDVSPESLADGDRALAWLTVEQPVLLAAVAMAARAGFDTHAWQLAWTITQFLNRQGRWDDLIAIQHVALAAARRSDDRAGQAHAHRGLAVAHLGRGGLEQARGHYRSALDLFGALGDHASQGYAHLGINIAYDREGRLDDALRHARHALDLFRTAGNPADVAKALNGIGWLSAQIGDERTAVTYCREALAIHLETGDRWGAAHTWDSLGYAEHRLGNHAAAVDCYEHALDLFRQTGESFYTATATAHLGDARHAHGDTDGARRAWHEALKILDRLGHPDAVEVRAKLDRPA